MNKAIHISHISKTYLKGQETALTDISFDVDYGEIFGLIGPDGAGKTTLFRILTTLLLPDNGSAKIAGFDLVKELWEIRKIVGYMPGKFSLYQDLSIEENLKFFATVFNTTLELNYDLIHDIYVQLEPFKDRPAGKLSGGMKQKLALCCALVHQPKVLFLDEPTTGVDPVSRKEFWDMLDGLKAKGIAILVSTPYMDEAARCDRIGLIQKGKLLDINTYEAILEKNNAPLLTIKADNMYRLLRDLRAHENVEHCYSFGNVHHVTLAQMNAENIIRLGDYLKIKKHENIVIDQQAPNIEDIFIELMQKAN